MSKGMLLAISPGPSRTDEIRGLVLGTVAVAVWSVTLPATRAAVAALEPVFVGLGRGVVAGCLAALYLALARQRRPTLREIGSLVIVAAGVVVGFPLLSALAMREVDAGHGGVMLGVLPLATALCGAASSRERPRAAFWVAAVAGSVLVMAFSLIAGAGRFRIGDVALIGAVACAAVGYAEGARLAKSLGGLQVISWALVIATPFLLVPAVLAAPPGLRAPPSAWAGFAYVSLMSQFLGFLPWYRGMTLGGIARVSQVQLLQPFLTLLAASLLLAEAMDAITIAFAIAVLLVVALGSRATISHGAS
ncbi:MAG TPA: DMT family transporter [Dongiaceae bacterium]|nr:DMT family transporter [Dongiaceae bacterium]